MRRPGAFFTVLCSLALCCVAVCGLEGEANETATTAPRGQSESPTSVTPAAPTSPSTTATTATPATPTAPTAVASTPAASTTLEPHIGQYSRGAKNASEEATCPPHQFRCDNGQCIPLRWRCDSSPDCPDHSDEPQDCDPQECKPGQFRCLLSRRCIPNDWHCDGENDCGEDDDLSDEDNFVDG